MTSSEQPKTSRGREIRPSSDNPLPQDQERVQRIAIGLVSGRVRMRALLELLEEKGVLQAGEFDLRAEETWASDHQELLGELLNLPQESEDGPQAPGDEEHPAGQLVPTPPSDALDPAAVLGNLITEAVSARVRLRAMLDLLEDKGILQPGEFEARADAVWDRDYEQLTRDFYQMKF